MLNLHRLAAGAEEYYLGTVASGVEDYYLGSGEAAGYWTGASADRFALKGTVDADGLRAVLGGADPRTGERLTGGGRGRPRTVPGWDATFRAPKSVTLLWALSDPAVAEQVRLAHDEAVAQALGYLERHAAMVRRGGEQVHAEGFVAAAFRHRTSRAGDPLLHTHVLIANQARTDDDGRWRALDARALHDHARTAGFVYQAVLREELTVRLGVAFGPVTNGYADLAGLPRTLIEVFSTRRSEIRELLAEQAEASAAAAQMAALATRRAKTKPPATAVLPVPGSKDYGVDPSALQQTWLSRAAPLGWTRERMRTLLHTTRHTPLTIDTAAATAADLAGSSGLTAKRSVFTRRDVIRGWAERLRQGASVARLEALADAVLAVDAGAVVRLRTAADADHKVVDQVVDQLAGRFDPQAAAEVRASAPLRQAAARALAADLDPAVLVAALTERELASAHDPAGVLVWRARQLAVDLDGGPVDGESSGRSVIRRGDGRAVTAQPSEPLYSTPDLVALERRAIDDAVDRQHARVAIADPAAVAAALASRPALAGEQADMVRRLTSSGAGVEVVVGKAGAGKTTALAAAREAWQASGVRVVGVALAARAARELHDGAGIDSFTVQQMQLDAHRHGAGLTRGSVLVIDEAAMVGTRELARLLDLAAAADAKVVLVGDHHQLPEIDAGGLFRGLQSRLPPIELTVNRRQRHAWERRALDCLRTGAVDEAFDAYRRAGRIVTGDDADATRQRLIDDWWAAADSDLTAHGLMLAMTRADVDDLNARARRRAADAGLLGSTAVSAAGRHFATGDAVVCTRNARPLDVDNGTRGRVIAVDPSSPAATITLRLADGTERPLPRAYLDSGDLTHGYALTGHGAQGQTVDRAWVLGTDLLYQEWAYTTLSRHREAAQLYVVGHPDPPEWIDHPEALAPDHRTPLERLIRAAHTSRAQRLAVDQGQVDPADAARGRTSILREQLRAALDRIAPSTPPDAWSEGHSQHAAVDSKVDLEVDSHPAESSEQVRAYLANTLGEPPGQPARRRHWSRAVKAIEGYRLRWNIDDPDQPLGQPPRDLYQDADHRKAMAVVRAAQRNLGVDHAGQQLHLDLTI